MARPPVVPPEEKSRLVLSILAGEMSTAEAARRAKVSEQSVSNWKRQFIDAGRRGVAEGGKPGPNARERQRRVKTHPRMLRSKQSITAV